MAEINSPLLEAAATCGPLQRGAPSLSPLQVFLLFLRFGLRAFGGPMAQIEMLKQELVVRDEWITMERFNKVFAAYQLIPGPEATELCIYFGVISGGRLGGLLAGLGFILPGFLLMLLLSWLYADYGLSNPHIRASLTAMDPAVAAMYLRAVHKIGADAISGHGTHGPDMAMLGLIAFSLCMSVFMRINFLIALVVVPVMNLCIRRRMWWGLVGIALLGVPLYTLYVLWIGYPATFSFGFNFGAITAWKVFLLGLITGLVSVGGAFSAVPFLQESGLKGGWITPSQFLQGLALSTVLPAPMVIFATFVGFLALRWLGAVLITIGLFMPAFAFPLAGHTLLDRLVQSKTAGHMLDGVLAAVLATVLISALQFLANAVATPLTAVLYVVYLGALYLFPHPTTTPMVVLVAAAAGQVLFVPS